MLIFVICGDILNYLYQQIQNVLAVAQSLFNEYLYRYIIINCGLYWKLTQILKYFYKIIPRHFASHGHIVATNLIGKTQNTKSEFFAEL